MSKSSPSGSTPPPLFPLFADLRGRAVLVVGGGTVARRKAVALLEAGAAVTIAAPELDARLRTLAAQGHVRHRGGAFQLDWLDDTWLVIAASDDADINHAVADAGQLRHVFVNVVDDAESSSLHVPARVRRGRLQIAISTGGAAPVLARRIRQRLEAELDESLAALTNVLARERARIRWRFPQPGRRRRFFERLLDGEWPQQLRIGDANAEATFERALQSGDPPHHRGEVTLVGAGAGDPGLLTLKALRALQHADVILHDRLIGPNILEPARRDAERIDVGKRVGEDHDASQTRIHDLMLKHAEAGRRVVRLHGGDPLVFGRGGEELAFLRAHAITHTVVPGITAALACAAAAGVPLTQRGLSRSVTMLAARGGEASQSPPWRALAAPNQTLAIYMGVGELENVTRELLAAGRDADTPFALVENGSLPNQRVVTGALAELPRLAHAENVHSPALLLVGEVTLQTGHVQQTERCSSGPPRVMSEAA
ncbi:MAG: siroheme synthase CysG [Rhodanobacteraceae bacterium]